VLCSAEREESIEMPEPVTSINAFYEKGNFFRVIHADGVFGGPSPRGNLTMSFYSERMSIPRQARIPIKDGIPGPEEVIDTKGGVFRELEATVVMDIANAVGFHQWLGSQISEITKQLGLSQDQIEQMTQGRAK
jgi:hypothetical protein